MKPRGDLMVDNRNAINGNKIESEEQGQHKPRNDRIKRGFYSAVVKSGKPSIQTRRAVIGGNANKRVECMGKKGRLIGKENYRREILLVIRKQPDPLILNRAPGGTARSVQASSRPFVAAPAQAEKRYVSYGKRNTKLQNARAIRSRQSSSQLHQDQFNHI